MNSEAFFSGENEDNNMASLNLNSETEAVTELKCVRRRALRNYAAMEQLIRKIIELESEI